MMSKILVVTPLAALSILLALPAAAAVDAPTFSRDVAPIFFENCAQCHRPGEVAPMSLLSYQEVRPWARSIAKQVQSRDMPPFSGESDRHEWSNDISLSDAEIATIVNWAKQGAAEGNPSDLPEVPTFADGWTLGEPDLVIALDRVDVPADGDDIFTVQRHEIALDGDRWVRAIEFLPGDRRVAHHFLATYGGGPTGVLAVWTAGMPPYVFPDGMGRVLGEKTTLQLDMHFHPMGEATSDVSQIGVYFGDGELQREVVTLAVANTGLRIPPGADHHPETAHMLFDEDMQILAFSPHMHLRGKAMSYELTYPDGQKEVLLDVPNYNFNWQWLYYPTQPIDIPAGSRLDVTAVWDNSAGNADNPDPTKEIIYRGDTFNEMFVGFVEAVKKDSVRFKPTPARQMLLSRLALHPAEDSYLVDGFLSLAFHAPRQGEGWLYLGQGTGAFSTSLDDFAWNGAELKIVTQFPTPDASATTTVIEGAVQPDGRFTGTLTIGSDTAEPQAIPIVGLPYDGSVSPSAGL
ncbi:MAG: cytochrome c [Acidobacteriota bacterium]|nr:cytochrome c [Acidobacteriota bacterium]